MTGQEMLSYHRKAENIEQSKMSPLFYFFRNKKERILMFSNLLSRWLSSPSPITQPLPQPSIPETIRYPATDLPPTYIPPSIPALAKDRHTIADYSLAIFNIELTNRCPFKCVMCARTNNMTREQGIMEFSVFKKIVDEFVSANLPFASNEEIWLHGFGESLVHPEFAKFMRYATDRGLFAGLSINPLMLTPEVSSALLEARPAHLYLSLDGHDNESFEKIRGVKNAYDRSKERMLAFLKQKLEGGYTTRITLSMIDFSLNQDSIAKMSEYWRSVEGIDLVLVKPFTTWDGSAEDVRALVDQKPISGSENLAPITCQMPWLKMTVKWDGDIVPCCFDYNKRYVLGNVKEQSLAKVWNGQRMQALRQEMMSDNVTNPLCRNCEQLRGG